MTDYARRAQALRRPKVKAADLGLTGVRAEKTSGDVEKVYIYAPIGGWYGVDAQYFAEMLNEVTASTIELHLNSPGGDAFDGIAIANLLRQHDATVNVVVDGLAASAASIIAMAGDDIAMAPGSQLMIHRAWALCIGNSQDMAKFAGELDHMDKQLAKQYAARAGGDVADWLELMTEETWYDDEEAVTAGLADRRLGDDTTDDEGSDELAVAAAWDLSIFAHAGRDHAPAPRFLTAAARSTKPAASAAGSKKNTARKETDVAFTDDQVETLRQMVGVSADADFDTFRGALDEALQECADGSAAVALPEGTVAIEKAQLEDLQARAALGVQAREQQLEEHREHVVLAAVREGRIPPARAEHWKAQLKADPGAEQVLASLAAVVNVTEIGHADAATTKDGSDTAVTYASLWPEDVEKEGA